MVKKDLTGRRFGRLIVIKQAESHKYPSGKIHLQWLCQCDCGTIKVVDGDALKLGNIQSCGCYHREKIKANYAGKRFGYLTVIKENGDITKSRGVIWLCKCDCGNLHNVESRNLTNGSVRSCGCLQRERNVERLTSHNMSRTRLYKIWQDMKTRCNNPNTPYFYKYGGRGISVCKEWETFEPFKEWALANGYKEDLTIDRIDVNGDYTPSNCRWITNKEQQFNKRTNRLLTFKGKTQTLTEWAEELGIKCTTLSSRINDYKWPIEKAMTTPVKTRRRR